MYSFATFCMSTLQTALHCVAMQKGKQSSYIRHVGSIRSSSVQLDQQGHVKDDLDPVPVDVLSGRHSQSHADGSSTHVKRTAWQKCQCCEMLICSSVHPASSCKSCSLPVVALSSHACMGEANDVPKAVAAEVALATAAFPARCACHLQQ